MRRKHTLLLGLAVVLGAGTATTRADGIEDAVKGQAMLGIDQSTGELYKYDFDATHMTDLGAVTSSATGAMTGIQAAVYFPGFQNIFALWTSPTDGKNKLVYVNVANGQANVVANDLEGGVFTGAAPLNTAATPYTVFAMQAAKVKPPSTISGLININPNNSNANEFYVTEPNGTTFSRDDLASSTLVLPSSGIYYQGNASLVHLKPKGNGNQNGLTIDGQAYALQNSNTYNFAGSMQVCVYNDKVSGSGTAMGHWWIQIVSGTVTINDQVQVLTPNRVVKVDQTNGTVTEVMRLSQTYSGLATADGVVFYAVNGGNLYQINTSNLTETEIGPLSVSKPAGMTFLGDNLVVYDQSTGSAVTVDPTTGKTTATVPGLTAGAWFPIMPAPTAQVVTTALVGVAD